MEKIVNFVVSQPSMVVVGFLCVIGLILLFILARKLDKRLNDKDTK